MTIAFADLVGFTRLGESLEIEQIGDLTGRLFELASDAARPPVRLVKMIGDAAMFASARVRVRCSTRSLELVEAAGKEEIPPLRAGVARGQALGRGGRLVRAPGQPGRRDHQLRLARQRRRRRGGEGLDRRVRRRGPSSFSFAGKRRFKGIEGEVPVHRVRRAEDGARVNPSVTAARNAG